MTFAETLDGVDMSGNAWYLFGYVGICPVGGCWNEDILSTHQVSRHFEPGHVGLMILCTYCGYRRVEWHRLWRE